MGKNRLVLYVAQTDSFSLFIPNLCFCFFKCPVQKKWFCSHPSYPHPAHQNGASLAVSKNLWSDLKLPHRLGLPFLLVQQFMVKHWCWQAAIPGADIEPKTLLVGSKIPYSQKSTDQFFCFWDRKLWWKNQHYFFPKLNKIWVSHFKWTNPLTN